MELNTVSNDSQYNRQMFASRAANELNNNNNLTLGFPEDVTSLGGNILPTISDILIVLASQDLQSNTSFWSSVVQKTLQLFETGKFQSFNDTGSNKPNVWSGLAGLAAYRAYNATSGLVAAKNSFNVMYADFLSDSAAQSGLYPRTISTQCGSKLGGLLFSNPGNTQDLTVEASVIGPWILLSARLYELTLDPTYLTAAEQSIQFLSTNLIVSSGSSTLVAGSYFDATSCSIAKGGFFHADDVGPYMEGLSIVANVTGNRTYTQIMNNLVPSILFYQPWHRSDGVLSQDTLYVTKGYLMRGLLEARLRNPSNAALNTLIDSYLTIQYNAVRDNALIIGSSDAYNISWIRYPDESAPVYSTVGSIEALDVLNAASVVVNDNFTLIPTNLPSKHSSTPIGAIVGATVAGVAVAAISLVLYILLRRRRRAREIPIYDQHNDTSSPTNKLPLLGAGSDPEPFVLTAPTRDQAMSTSEKGDSRKRAPFLPQSHSDNDTSSNPTSSSSVADAAGYTSVAQIRPDAGDSDALHALERRLERRLGHLVRTLVNYGETMSNPPEYDENGASHPTNGDDLAQSTIGESNAGADTPGELSSDADRDCTMPL
ncbi:hypothetical protein PENSPDRAFT_26746 [Peniophora sp. CONT]|nr:hypothetical protein PENSPDRAFT_26746 [Peniophora sp. CONT]